jgi:hypothetical protein
MDFDDDVVVAYFLLQQQATNAIAAFIAVDSRPVVDNDSEDDDDIYPLQKRRRLKEKMRGLREIMSDQFNYSGGQTKPLQKKNVLSDLFADPNRNYSKLLLGIFGWEFFALHNQCRENINSPRSINAAHKYPCKHDSYTRLYQMLEWLRRVTPCRTSEFTLGWAKTSCNDDIPHVLKSVINNLENQIEWPDAATRVNWASEHTGVFHGNIGIGDIKETEIEKPKNLALERATWSGKMQCNTLKTLSVISRDGKIIFMITGIPGGRNDRDIWTSCELYLERDRFFSIGEWIAFDGAFRGDGPNIVSYNDIRGDPDRELFNSIFTEVRKYIENSYGRVAMWFPILGNAMKRWTYNHTLFKLTVMATYRLHNWLMHIRGLNYNPSTNPNSLFTRFY